MTIKTLILFSVFTIFGSAFADAQIATVGGPLTNVTFSVLIGTNVVTTNVAVNVTAVIKNPTAESLGKTDRDMTFLSLIDRKGDAYEFSLRRADWGNMFSHKVGDAVIPYSSYEWPLSLDLSENIFAKKVVPGTYLLQAECEFFEPNKTYRLLSNTLRVKIQ